MVSAFTVGVLLTAPLPAFAAEPDTGCPSAPRGHVPEATQPLNLGELKLQLFDYKCFGDYDREVARVLASARAYVQLRAKQVTKPALVLDIDETSLSNWQEIVANDFGYIPEGRCDALPKGPCGVGAWALKGKATAIRPTRDLFVAAKASGVAVFFITGRTERQDEREATSRNLNDEGYEGWTELYMRPEGAYPSVAKYKTAMRQKIEEQGFAIIANVGDQWSDLDGGHAERTFRVPNPFYFLP